MLFVFKGTLVLVVLTNLTLHLLVFFAENISYWLFGCVYFLPTLMFWGEV